MAGITHAELLAQTRRLVEDAERHVERCAKIPGPAGRRQEEIARRALKRVQRTLAMIEQGPSPR